MSPNNLFSRAGRGLALGAAILGVVGLTTVPQQAHALSPAAGVGIGLGAFAAGTALGAASNPYYHPYGYSGYGYSYPYSYPTYGYYYPSAPAYYPQSAYAPRSCWDPYSQRYYAC